MHLVSSKIHFFRFGMLYMSLKSEIRLQHNHFHYKRCIIFDQLISFCIDQSLSQVDGLRSVA